MYSLDINFLNDREDRVIDVKPVSTAGPAPVGDRRPLVFGLAFLLGALALMGGYWLMLRSQVRQLQAESADLDQQIAEVDSQLQAVNNLRAQIDTVRAETNAFVSIFDAIRPWSALLQDIKDRTPARVQIEELSQTAGDTLENKGAQEPPVAGGIEITGQACSFDDVNDFILLLQRSQLLDGNSVQLTGSNRSEDPLAPEEGTCPGSPPGSLVFLVDYTIRANLTPTPSSQLVEELASKGTVGLVDRLEALRETGVIE